MPIRDPADTAERLAVLTPLDPTRIGVVGHAGEAVDLKWVEVSRVSDSIERSE